MVRMRSRVRISASAQGENKTIWLKRKNFILSVVPIVNGLIILAGKKEPKNTISSVNGAGNTLYI